MKTKELTPKEKEVASFLVLGFSDQEIANELGIKYKTAKFHVSNILDKYDVKSRAKFVYEFTKSQEVQNDLPPAA